MARRERDRFGRGDSDDQRGDARGARPAPGPSPQRPAGPRPAQGPTPQRSTSPRPAPQPQRPRSVAEDPNAYRSPGFQDVDQNPYKIDYAGLPRDVEEEAAEAAGQGAESSGAPAPQAPRRDPALPRGMLGRNADRKGTDPNAYRSPAFQDLDRMHRQFAGRRRGPVDARPRGAVRPDGAPADEPEVAAVTAVTEAVAAETPVAPEGGEKV